MRSERAVLIAAGGGIGDTLLAGAVADALHQRYAGVDGLVLPAHLELAAHIPGLDEVRPFGNVRATTAALRRAGYAAAVVTWATATTALVPWLAGIPERVGQTRRLYSPLFTRRVAVRSEHGDRTTHWTQILLDYARALGCEGTGSPRFALAPADRLAARALLAERGVVGPFAVLHPTRGLAAQRARWPLGGFAALARALRARDGLPLLVTGSAEDDAIASAVAAAAGGVSVAGATTIGAFGALAAEAAYVVAMDSGPMHVAAAVGAPTVGIFALQSDEPDRWAPLGARVAVVRATYPCPPEHRKETCPDFACLRELDVAAVLSTLDGLVSPPAERRA